MNASAAAPSRGSNLDLPRLQEAYHLMQRIRSFEELAVDAQKEGLVLSAIHPSIGQKQSQWVCAQLVRTTCSTHRGTDTPRQAPTRSQ